jgi:hypothetical protein
MHVRIRIATLRCLLHSPSSSSLRKKLRSSLPQRLRPAQVSAFRRRVERVVGDKHEEAMARMGAIMAAGLLDAGGRNATPALRSHSGYFRRTSVVALALFTQYWCGARALWG